MSNTTGYNSTITIDQVIASVQADLGIMGDNSYSIVIEKWINEGLRHTGTNQLFVKRPAILTLQDGRAELPVGFRKLLGIRAKAPYTITTPGGTAEQRIRYLPMLYLDTNFINECGITVNDTEVNSQQGLGYRNYLSSYQIVGNEIVANGTIPDGTEIQISYLGFSVDEDCMLIIRSDFERALSAYARYKFWTAFPERKPQFSMTLMQDAKREWSNQKKWLKALATSEEFNNNRYMIRQLSKAWFISQSVSQPS
jgi:hypothetical protein